MINKKIINHDTRLEEFGKGGVIMDAFNENRKGRIFGKYNPNGLIIIERISNQTINLRYYRQLSGQVTLRLSREVLQREAEFSYLNEKLTEVGL